MTVFDIKSWTVFGLLRWFLAAVIGAFVLFVAGVVLDENIQNIAEDYGWNTLLRKGLSAMPDILFRRETWFTVGLFGGATAMVWLMWAFPHRLGESAATNSKITKWSTPATIAICLCAAFAYLRYGRQPVLPTMSADIENAAEPFKEALLATNKLLSEARNDVDAARNANGYEIDVSSLPTHLRLQFSANTSAPQEIDSANIH